jgi:hypothetical protein
MEGSQDMFKLTMNSPRGLRRHKGLGGDV